MHQTDTQPEMTDDVRTTLQGMHPDPFVQVAIWRLFREAPGLLDPAAVINLTQATTKGA